MRMLLIGAIIVFVALTGRPTKGEFGSDCILDNGDTYSHGRTFNTGDCQIYKCVNGHLKVVDEGCKKPDGSCIKVGEEFKTSKCILLKCTKEQTLEGGTLYAIKSVFAGCASPNGTCYVPGAQIFEDCVVWGCRRFSTGPRSAAFKSIPLQSYCKDADGFCRSDGETTPSIVNGRREENCRCKISEATTEVNCSVPAELEK